MSMSDLMSRMDLSTWPEIALVIFLGVFFAVVIRLFLRRRSSEFREAAQLALDDGAAVGARKERSS